MSVGILLRQARESSGMSLEELAAITCIRRNIIRDLEADDFRSSGGLAYARGHLRSIAKALQANGDLLVDEFNAMNEDFNRPMIDLLSENNATPIRPAHKSLSFSLMAKVAAVVVALLIAIPTAGSFFHSTTKKPTVTSTTNVVKDQVATDPTLTSSGTTAVATKTTPVAITVTAVNGSTWLGVTNSSGTQVFGGKLAKGISQSFDDSQLINVTIGNAGAVDLNVNGKDVGIAGTTGEVVHLQFGPGSSSQG